MKRIGWFALCLMVIGGFAWAEVDMEKVAGIWLFDEGAGDVAGDSSGNGHDGQITGAKWENGRFGKALHFDAGSGVRVESTDKLHLGERFTMMAYFSTEELNDWHQLIAKNNEYLLRIDTPGEGSRMSAFVNLAGGWEPRASANVPPKNTWIHFAAVYVAADELLTVYVDGAKAGQSTRVGKGNPNQEPVTFGHWNNGSHFIGLIDEVAIFQEALPEEDILAIATDGLEVYLGGGLSVQAREKLATTWGTLKRH